MNKKSKKLLKSLKNLIEKNEYKYSTEQIIDIKKRIRNISENIKKIEGLNFKGFGKNV